MDLLIEASVPGVPGLPIAASPGETAPQDSAFGELLQTLLGAGAAPQAEAPPSESIEALPVSVAIEEEAPSEDGAPQDGLVDALAAALALLSLGLVQLATPAVAGPDAPPATEEAATGAVASPTSPAAAQAAPVEASTVDVAAPAGETPSAEPGDPDAVVAESPGVAPPAPAETPPPLLQSVVRLVGNAEPASGDGADVKPAARDTSQPASVSQALGPQVQPQLAASSAAIADTPVAPAPLAPLPPVAQVAHAVIERVAEGGGDVRLRLDPPDLGEILIHVTVDGGDVRVDVHADNADAARLLRDATPNLSTLLGERGLGLADVSVGHGGRENNQQGFGQGSFNQSGNRDGGAFAALIGIDASAESRQFNRVRATYNPDGAFLYRI